MLGEEIDGFREKELEETLVAVVEVDDDREREKLALVETDLPDWLEKRENLLARLSMDAFLVCDGERLGITGASFTAGAGLVFGATK